MRSAIDPHLPDFSAQMPSYCSSVTGKNQTFGPGGGGEFVAGGLEVLCVVLRGEPVPSVPPALSFYGTICPHANCLVMMS